MLLTGQGEPIQVFMGPVSNRLVEGDVFDIGSVDSGGGGGVEVVNEVSEGLCVISTVQSSLARDSGVGENPMRAQTRQGVSISQPRLMHNDVWGKSRVVDGVMAVCQVRPNDSGYAV